MRAANLPVFRNDIDESTARSKKLTMKPAKTSRTLNFMGRAKYLNPWNLCHNLSCNALVTIKTLISRRSLFIFLSVVYYVFKVENKKDVTMRKFGALLALRSLTTQKTITI
jgi:hypothetical protein